MKRIFALVLALCLCSTLAVPVMAADSGMDNFQKINQYKGQFADMPENYWGTRWAAICYEYGLMQGKSADAFVPQGNLSIAEAIVMADRIHEIYTTGESTLASGDPWYQPYVDYAVEKGMIFADAFTDYTADASRYLVAQLLYIVIPDEDLAPINAISDVPDVPSDWIYAPGIYSLYRAGVLTGSDMYGTFHPEKSITRAEAAAILARLVIPELRQEIMLMKEYPVSSAETGEELVCFTVPQQMEVAGENPYTLSFSQEDWGLMVSFAGERSDSYRGKTIGEVFTPEELQESWSLLFTGTTASSSLVQYGKTEACVTVKTPGAPMDQRPDENMMALDFLADDVHVKVFVWGSGDEELFWTVAESIRVKGSVLNGLNKDE